MDYQTTFYVFLLLFIVGGILLYFIYGKSINQFQDYIAINRSIGNAPLTIVMITYTVSGSLMWFRFADTALYGISNALTRGIYYSMTFLIFAHYIYPRLLAFRNTYTLGGVMKHMYGQLAGAISSLFSSIACCYSIYYQFISLSRAIPFFTQNRSFFLILVGVATIVQALWISNHRISTTSIIQFMLIVSLLFSLVSTTYYLPKVQTAGGGLQGLWRALKADPSIPYNKLLTYNPGWGSILNGLLFPSTLLYPTLIQRVLINRDNQQMQNASWGVAIFHIFFRCLMIIIGLGTVLMVMPEQGTTISQFRVMLLSSLQNKWLGFLLYLLLAFISSIGFMSYLLHSLSVELVQNLIKPYRKKELKDDNRWIRSTILIIGFLCILLALVGKQSYYSLFYPLFTFMLAILAPFILGCIGLKGNNKIFITGIVTFYVTSVGLLIANRYGYFPILEGLSSYRRLARTMPLGILFSVMAILVAHLLTYFDFVFREDQKENLLLKLRRKNRKETFWAMLANPLLWAKEKFARYDNNPTTIGTFLILCLALPNPSGDPSKFFHSYLGILIPIKIIGIALSTVMMFHNFFPYSLQKIFPLLWFLSLSYCIPFCNGFEVLCNPHNPALIAKLVILLLCLRILIDYRTFLVLVFMGVLGAYIAYVGLLPPHPVTLSFQQKALFIELVALLVIISTTFVSHQEAVSNSRVQKSKSLASGFSHDLRNLFQYTSWMVAHSMNDESILEVLINRPHELQKDSKVLKKLIRTTKSVNMYLEECLKECQVFYELICNDDIDPSHIKEIEVKKFIEETVNLVPSIFRDKIKVVARKDVKIISHPTILKSAILNLIKNSFKHGNAAKVIVGWDHKEGRLYVRDNGVGISPEKEPYIFELYYTTGGTGIGLPFIKTMLERIYGSITFITSPKETTFYIDLPQES